MGAGLGGATGRWWGPLVGAAGGLLVDVDHPGSTVSRWLRWPLDLVWWPVQEGRWRNGRRFAGWRCWHRGPVHSLTVGAVISGLTAVGWGDWAAGVIMGGGWVSHLALDTVSPSGMPLLWPWKKGEIRMPWGQVTVQGRWGPPLEVSVRAVAVAGCGWWGWDAGVSVIHALGGLK